MGSESQLSEVVDCGWDEGIMAFGDCSSQLCQSVL